MQLTPGQAHYVITRLVNERRLTTNDITRYLGDLQQEITTIEARLQMLRDAQPNTAQRTSHTIGVPSNTTPSKGTPSNATAPNTTPRRRSRTTRSTRRLSPATRALRQLQGRYLGYMRQLSAHDRPRFQAIKARKGYPAAITALQRYFGK